MSVLLPCPGRPELSTHYIHLPVTFDTFRKLAGLGGGRATRSELNTRFGVRRFDQVVCIGCDAIYGPNRKKLETSFPRPFSLYLEFPYMYHHDLVYRKMGTGASNQQTMFTYNHDVDTNATTYTERAMRIIRLN